MAERYHDPDLPKVILFIDEMHQIMPACEGSAYKGLSEVMKPYLTVGGPPRDRGDNFGRVSYLCGD